MKVIVPVQYGNIELPLKEEIRLRGTMYKIPYDVDWMTSYTSEERTWYGVVGVIGGLVLTPISLGLGVLLLGLGIMAYKREMATVEIQFVDGMYLRGFTRSKKEVRLAERYTVAPRPIVEYQHDERPTKKDRSNVVKLVKSTHK